MTTALLVYGTRTGTTVKTAELIANVLRQEGFTVRIINAKNEKIQSISEYELIIVGSGIQMGRWTKEPEQFLRRFQHDLSTKRLALFVSCGAAHPLDDSNDPAQEQADACKKYLESKAAKYTLHPIALGLFGAIYDFNKMSWFFRKTMSGLKPQLEAAGYHETAPDVYDTRNIPSIQQWARELTQRVRE
jgi:menaquinone-dependent protoporphyrinogen oxidase